MLYATKQLIARFRILQSIVSDFWSNAQLIANYNSICVTEVDRTLFVMAGCVVTSACGCVHGIGSRASASTYKSLIRGPLLWFR